MSHKIKLLQAGAFAFAMLVVPVLASAGELTPSPVTKIDGKVTLTAEVGGVSVKGSSVTVAPKSDIKLKWTVPAGFLACAKNWDSVTSNASGDVSGTLPANASKVGFVITCYKAGVAQTASLVVMVQKPTLVLSAPKVSATKVNGRILPAPSPFVLTYTVKNSSKVNISSPTTITLYRQFGDASWAPVAGQPNGNVPTLRPGESKTFTFDDSSFTKDPGGAGYAYRVCVVNDAIGIKPSDLFCSPQTPRFIF